MNKVVTNQRKTIEVDYPKTLEDLQTLVEDFTGYLPTKKEIMDFLFRNRIAKYQKGEKFGMICPIITPYDRFYNNEKDLSLYQTGEHCAMVITHKKGYLNCYPRFDIYTQKLIAEKFGDYLISIGKGDMVDEDPLDDEDIRNRWEWDISKDD